MADELYPKVKATSPANFHMNNLFYYWNMHYYIYLPKIYYNVNTWPVCILLCRNSIVPLLVALLACTHMVLSQARLTADLSSWSIPVYTKGTWGIVAPAQRRITKRTRMQLCWLIGFRYSHLTLLVYASWQLLTGVFASNIFRVYCVFLCSCRSRSLPTVPRPKQCTGLPWHSESFMVQACLGTLWISSVSVLQELIMSTSWCC